MKTEENNRMEALACIIADLKAENMMMTERDEAKTHVAKCESQKNELFELIHRFENSDFMGIGEVCTYKSFAPEDSPVKVGSTKCVTCRHFLKMDKSFCVLCACRYDYMKGGETKEHKNAND